MSDLLFVEVTRVQETGFQQQDEQNVEEVVESRRPNASRGFEVIVVEEK